MQLKFGLLVTAVCAGILAMQGSAQAVPYAYATNQYSALLLTQVDPTSGDVSQVSGVTSTSQTVSAKALYGGFPGATTANTGPVYIWPDSGTLDTGQAFSGTGTVPGENTFGQAGPGTFAGSRADANVGAATSITSGITVNNVAEGNGSLLGSSDGTNDATIAFQIAVTTATKIRLSFSAFVKMLVSTDTVAEQATASIKNTFSISKLDGTIVDSYSPTEINRQISSLSLVPPINSYETTFAGDFTSVVLGEGIYNISLSSGSHQTISTRAIPEPASLALLGAGLVGLGLIRRRRRAG